MAIPSLGRTLRRIAWVVVAAVIALGGAGLVAGASLPPTDATRPELTVRGDALMAPGLAALDTGLTAVDDGLGQLVGTGEQVLVDLTGMTSDTVAAAQISTDLQQGDDQLLALEEQAQALQSTYAQLPYDASSDHISGRTKGRLAAIRQALDLLAPVTGDWQAVVDACHRHGQAPVADGAARHGRRASRPGCLRHRRRRPRQDARPQGCAGGPRPGGGLPDPGGHHPGPAGARRPTCPPTTSGCRCTGRSRTPCGATSRPTSRPMTCAS